MGSPLQSFVVGCAYLFGGKNASELEETIDGIIKIGWRTGARVHRGNKLGGVNLTRAWNVNSWIRRLQLDGLTRT